MTENNKETTEMGTEQKQDAYGKVVGPNGVPQLGGDAYDSEYMDEAPLDPINVPLQAAPDDPQGIYTGIATTKLTATQIAILLAPVDRETISIRPDGFIYMSEIQYRRRLNLAFRPGAWGLRPLEQPFLDGSIMVYHGAMYANGAFFSESYGENDYYEGGKMSKYSAMEGAKSNCLVRCCKDLGMFSEMWDHRFGEEWKNIYATQVWCKNKGNKGPSQKPLWRRKDEGPIDSFPWEEIISEPTKLELIQAIKNYAGSDDAWSRLQTRICDRYKVGKLNDLTNEQLGDVIRGIEQKASK